MQTIVMSLGGAVAEWSKALPLREKINENEKISGPRPGQPLKQTIVISKVQLNNLDFQAGPCSDTVRGLLYYNSFLIADHKEAWVLETVRKFWAAQKITSKPFSSSMRPRGQDEGSYGAKQQ